VPDLVHHLKLAGVWTEITDDVLNRDTISITRGRSAEGVRTEPGKLTLSLLNPTGKYSPRNPSSPLYGLIGRNTPIRTSVRAATTLLVPAAGQASTPDTAVLDITGDLDVRVDVTSETLWSVTINTPYEIIGKYDNVSGNQRSWRLTGSGGVFQLGWSPDGTAAAFIFATCPETLQPSGPGRLAMRATLDVDNGAGGWTATFYTAPTLDGPWVQLGTPVTGAGVTSIYSGTAPLAVGATTNTGVERPTMRVHAAEVRSGIGGTVVASPSFTTQADGTAGFTDSAGRVWTVTAPATVTDVWPRICAEVSEWPPRWDLSGQDVWTPITAEGILRRLGQGKTPLQSPMRREFGSPTRTGVVAYWPMEDGSRSTQFASALSGGAPLAITGTAAPAAYSGWPASGPLPTLGTATATAPLPVYTATGQTALRLWLKPPAAGVASEQRVLTMTGTGTAARWTLSLTTTGGLRLRAYDGTGTAVLDSGVYAAALNGLDASVGVELTESGGAVNWTLISQQHNRDSMFGPIIQGGLTGTLAANTVGRITTVTVGEDLALGDTVVGHIAIANSTTAYANTGSALAGWAGETAQARIARLCTENGISFVSLAIAFFSIQVGPQPAGTLLQVLETAAEADGGILSERIDDIGLAYRSRYTLYNQTPSITLSFDVPGEVPPGLAPTEDDQGTANDITVKRLNGSSARAVLESGRMSVLDPPNGVGRVDDAPELNLYQDAQLTDVAGWLLHVRTVDAPRYPKIPVDLIAGPHLIEQALGAAAGDRIVIDDPPPWLPPDDIDQMVQGWTETLSLTDWRIEYNCTPYEPWRIGVLDDTVLGRADTDGSTLASSATSTATALSVATTTGPTWVTTLSEAPYDLTIAGEVVTVVAAGTQLAANPLLLVDGTGWSGMNATAVRSTAVVNTARDAEASLLITPNGSSASGGASGTPTGVGTVTPGASYRVCMWAYSPGGHADLRPAIDWADAAGTFISSGLGSGTAVAAGVWTYIEQTLTAPALASQATPRARHGGTPATGAIWYAWAIRLVPVATITTTSPQTLTVVRSRNGVIKALPSGSDVRLTTPMILSL
jgi:hypothetical protein